MAGEASPEELMSDIKEGIYIIEMLGMGINYVTGDYSRGAAGFWIEDGALAWPVSEITIAGNLAEMFLKLTAGQRSRVPLWHRRADAAGRRHDRGRPVSDGPDLESDRRLLRRAVTAAGALALEHFRAGPAHWYKGPGQVVTQADLAIDGLLHEVLIGARPEDGWLSEERADDGSRQRRRRVWVVDPIDGTRAFADGEPEFAISVALVVEGRRCWARC